MKNESIKRRWYTIFNPSSGGGTKQNKIDRILSSLKQHQISYEFIVTQYTHHEEQLVQSAIDQGYLNFICIGGDGTIHHMINGIMKQKNVASDQITLAVIPIGTGNDWVKNYRIPKDPEKAIRLIHNNKIIYQDIGKISFLDDHKEVYFNNAAGIGFDAFVVKNISKYKKWGSLAYIIAALVSLKTYTPGKITYVSDTDKKTSRMFLIALGICKFSGAGMQLTDYKNHKKGYLDITFVKPISLSKVITQIFKLYNGKIATVEEAVCFHSKKFKADNNTSCYIQADGELVGRGNAQFNLIYNAVQFIIP
ncbi:diacylglycerol kinase family protein [Lutimonas vermicola]|uniref:Diacylglycerol kinase family protein n=1 Tax=Lutimonas vermicola TaxID=414288 RepID=A0ABU9L6D5_9FLAO